jgi:hypothetical protein
MPTKQSVHDVEFKALSNGSGDTGQFEALVSIFGNVDHGGDRVVKGAFTDSITELREKGDPLPILWSHSWGDPNAHIGFARPEDIEETDQGLKVKGQLDIEENQFARQVYKLLKERRVKEFSFSYDIRREKRAKDGANELLQLGLIEAGPTLKGMNPDTELLGVKADLEAAAAKSEAESEDAESVEEHVCSCGKAHELGTAYVDLVPRIVNEEAKASDGITFGTGYIDLMVRPDGEKAGRRISRATESELRGAISTLRAEIDRLEGLLPAEDSDDEKSEVEDDAPAGKSIDDVNLKARLLIDRLR